MVALYRQSVAWTPFGWGRSVIVEKLERDLIGLRTITYGNGVQGQWQRSREGVLARVVYRGVHESQPVLRTAIESLIPPARAEATDDTAPANVRAPGAFGLPREAAALWDGRLLYDAAGNVVVQAQFADNALVQPRHVTYAYDAQDQLVQAARTNASGASLVSTAPAQPTVWRYHYDSLGHRLLAQQGVSAGESGRTIKTAEPSQSQLHDAAGRPLRQGSRHYAWDALGRLARVDEDGTTLGRYRYNRLGLRTTKQTAGGTVHYLYDEQRHRAAELDSQGRLTREYIWLGEQLVAVIDPAQARALQSPAQGAWQRVERAAQVAWRRLAGGAPRIAFVHVNHLGAPVAMTDERGRPVWSAQYAPFGQRIQGQGAVVKTEGHTRQHGGRSMRLDLRLPGQWEDEESRLYYNDRRTYDPRSGRYLSPDPLGVAGGLNAYAYVGNNPLAYADPLGLILFAFDGTNNTDDLNWLHEAANSSLSNVVNFRKLYADGDCALYHWRGHRAPRSRLRRHHSAIRGLGI